VETSKILKNQRLQRRNAGESFAVAGTCGLRVAGVIVCDDLEMKAIAAHYDVPSAAIDAIASAIGDGRIPADRVLDAELRRAALVRKFVR
jgi:hypothetical protein